jgi:hypothetical protein
MNNMKTTAQVAEHLTENDWTTEEIATFLAKHGPEPRTEDQWEALFDIEIQGL